MESLLGMLTELCDPAVFLRVKHGAADTQEFAVCFTDFKGKLLFKQIIIFVHLCPTLVCFPMYLLIVFFLPSIRCERPSEKNGQTLEGETTFQLQGSSMTSVISVDCVRADPRRLHWNFSASSRLIKQSEAGSEFPALPRWQKHRLLALGSETYQHTCRTNSRRPVHHTGVSLRQW